MGPLTFLQRLFSGSGGATSERADGGYYVRVRCDACGEIIQARINRSNELSQQDDGKTYFVRKVLVGQQCFRPIQLELTFNGIQGAELSREVKGGTSVD